MFDFKFYLVVQETYVFQVPFLPEFRDCFTCIYLYYIKQTFFITKRQFDWMPSFVSVNKTYDLDTVEGFMDQITPSRKIFFLQQICTCFVNLGVSFAWYDVLHSVPFQNRFQTF